MLLAPRTPLAALLLTAAACSAPPLAPASPTTATTAEIPVPTATVTTIEPPVPTATTEPTSAPVTAVPSGPPPYPEEWIREAHEANDAIRCQEVIYRNGGCSRPRTGKVTVELTLAADGKVTRVQPIENTVTNEPEVVWRCLKQKLPRWKLHAPDGVSRTLRLTLGFHDKC